jgi:hypothetical protein
MKDDAMKDDAQEATTMPGDDHVVPIRMSEGAPSGSDKPRAGAMHRTARTGAIERSFWSTRPHAPTPLPGTTLKTVERKLDRRYFWLWGIRYGFRLPARLPGAAPGRAVRISFDPQDIGTVWVQDPATGRFVEARPVGASARASACGLSVDEHLALCKAAREREASALAERATIVAAARERIRTIAASATRRARPHDTARRTGTASPPDTGSALAGPGEMAATCPETGGDACLSRDDAVR